MENWEITIVNESEEGYLVMAPTGDTFWMSKEDYQTYLENKK